MAALLTLDTAQASLASWQPHCSLRQPWGGWPKRQNNQITTMTMGKRAHTIQHHATEYHTASEQLQYTSTISCWILVTYSVNTQLHKYISWRLFSIHLRSSTQEKRIDSMRSAPELLAPSERHSYQIKRTIWKKKIQKHITHSHPWK